MSNDRITRHKLADRLFHWVMAVCMLTLLATGLLPVLGMDFGWVVPHWIAGLILTVSILAHIIRSLFWKSLKALWISRHDLKSAVGGNNSSKPGKYSLEQKLMHHGVTLFSLVAIVSGLLMLVKIDMPFWERDPYWLSAAQWGTIYVLHGLAALFFLSLIMLHVYFALRPEKAMYLKSMVRGWMSRDEYLQNHDPALWPTDTTTRNKDDAA